MKYTLTENCKVFFTAHAPMHAFKGWAIQGLSGKADIDFDNLLLHHIEATVETRFFDTGDAKRNKAMFDFFALENNPTSSFTMTECREFERITHSKFQLTILGVLDFTGIRRQLPITCTLNRETKNLSLDLQFKWSFKAFGLKAPRLLFLTVRDIVDIKAHLEFTQDNTSEE